MADPCDECGFDWSISVDDADDIITSAAEEYAGLMEGHDGAGSADPGVWSPVAYVWHVADVLRIGAERTWAARQDPDFVAVPYEQDDLAAVRGYAAMPRAAAFWALESAVRDWRVASEGADPTTLFRHPEMDDGTVLADHTRRIAHEVHHHALDIKRGLGLA